jgi:hypothetical protein
MASVGKVHIPQLLSSIVIRFRTIALTIFNIFLNHFVTRLTNLNYFVKIISRPAQSFLGVITGNHYSLVNVSDDNFSFGITACHLFRSEYKTKDYNNPDIHDVFHIYLSKILYEQPAQIINQCKDWGFREESIKILRYQQVKDLKEYTYSTQAALLHHDESNRIIIAFRGTESMDLLQWMTGASTDSKVIDNVFKDDVDNDDNTIRVHAGFYYALGLSAFNPSVRINSNEVTKDSPIFLQLLNHIQKLHQNDNKCNISITGHSLGGALASLFSFVLLSYGYESSISGVYTYGQPLVGNRRYAEILNKKLGNRIHRWVNHCDIVTRIPVIELPSLAWDYTRTPYSDALEVATKDRPKEFNQYYKHYYHSGLRFKIDRNGDLARDNLIDQGPILAYLDGLDSFHLIYSIRNGFFSWSKITPFRSIC